MTESAKTIEIFLPDGDPKSLRVATITSRTIQATYIPRFNLDIARKRKDLKSVGVYILVGESENKTKPEVYIGEAENLINRINQHNATKDFWTYAIGITSKINFFTKTHVKFLEWFFYDLAKNLNRCF
ncbi:MAG: GIY-YIG nuclease family protein [Alphaproteobacteria bacterium]